MKPVTLAILLAQAPPYPNPRDQTRWRKKMIAALVFLMFATTASAQTTFRDANGRISGSVTTDSTGTKTFRNGTGRTTGTATIDANGMATFRDAGGRTTGTASTPRR